MFITTNMGRRNPVSQKNRKKKCSAIKMDDEEYNPNDNKDEGSIRKDMNDSWVEVQHLVSRDSRQKQAINCFVAEPAKTITVERNQNYSLTLYKEKENLTLTM